MSHIEPDRIPYLDHLVLLVNHPHSASQQIDNPLDKAISVFSELGFILIRGGRHADHLTSNALLVFPDGVYIELIQFEPSPPNEDDPHRETQKAFEERRKNHWWYDCKPGWIDWCLLGGIRDEKIITIQAIARQLRLWAVQLSTPLPSVGSGGDDDSLQVGMRVQHASHPRLFYQPSIQGGRVTLDDKQISWDVTFPSPPGSIESETGLTVGNKRGSVPFWCQDQNPREWRVPRLPCSHPNLSTGISSITLMYSSQNALTSFWDISLSLFQTPSDPSPLLRYNDLSMMERNVSTPLLLRAPADVEDEQEYQGSASLPRSNRIKVHFKIADDPQEVSWIEQNGEGLYEVELYVSASKLPSTAPPDGVERATLEAGYGRIRLHPIMH